MELTPSGYVPEGDIFKLSSEEIESLSDKAIIKAAAQKITHLIPPHVITDERWSTLPTSNRAVDLEHHGLSYKAFFKSNLEDCIRLIKIYRTVVKREQQATGYKLALVPQLSFYVDQLPDLLFGRDSEPDVSVDGNLFHWAEHGEFTALFSPLVVETLGPVLTAESRLLSRGKTPDATTSSLVNFSKAILNKKIWGEQEEVQRKSTRREQRTTFMSHAYSEAYAQHIDHDNEVYTRLNTTIMEIMGLPRWVSIIMLKKKVKELQEYRRTHLELTADEDYDTEQEILILTKLIAYEKSF